MRQLRMSEIFNEARILDLGEGLASLEIDVATRIMNPKRRALLVNLALDQVASLEKLVHEMEYEEVERLHSSMQPIHSSNGNGK